MIINLKPPLSGRQFLVNFQCQFQCHKISMVVYRCEEILHSLPLLLNDEAIFQHCQLALQMAAAMRAV